MIPFILALVAGVLVQGSATLWVVSVERRQVAASTALAMVTAAGLIIGVGRSQSLGAAVGYILGVGLASALVVAGSRAQPASRTRMELPRD